MELKWGCVDMKTHEEISHQTSGVHWFRSQSRSKVPAKPSVTLTKRDACSLMCAPDDRIVITLGLQVEVQLGDTLR